MQPRSEIVELHENEWGSMARLRGVDPPTSGSGDQRSIQLSYRRVFRVWIFPAEHLAQPPESGFRRSLPRLGRKPNQDKFTLLLERGQKQSPPSGAHLPPSPRCPAHPRGGAGLN